MACCSAAVIYPSAEPTGDPAATNSSQTVPVELTRAAQQELSTSHTPSPSASTQLPQASPTPAAASAKPEAAGCTDRAAFVTNVTVPDDTNFGSGEDFTKTRRLPNASTCTCTEEFDLIFDSSRAMAGPASLRLSGSVPANSTVDISVELTAPTTNGSHRGNWKLRNADNVTFGIGDDAEVAFWVLIEVAPPAPVQAYDFVAKYCDADWVSGAGVITGTFPLFNVQDGDVFRAVIGCRQGGNNCQVTYQLNARPDGGSLQNLAEWDETYDGNINEVEVDLSSLAGQSVRFTLAIQADGSSSQDWALWLSPRIMRQQ